MNRIVKVRRFAAWLLVFAMLAAVSGCGQQTSSLDSVINSGKMRFGTEPDMVPLSFVSGSDETAEYTGLCVDIARELAKRLNVEPVFVPLAQSEAEEALSGGEIDCYITFADVDIKTSVRMFTIETGITHRQVLVVPENGAVSKISDITNNPIGCVSGSDAEAALADASVISREASAVIRADNINVLLDMLDSGTITAAVADEAEYMYVRGSRVKSYNVISSPIAESNIVLALALRSDSLSERVKLLFTDMQDDGTVGRLRTKWLGE